MITVITLDDVVHLCQEVVYDGATFLSGTDLALGWVRVGAKHVCDAHHTFQACLPAE